MRSTIPTATAMLLSGIVIDATERKRAEARVTEQEARYRAITDSIDQMIWSTRPDGHHDYYNHRWYEFTGVPDGSTDGEGWNGHVPSRRPGARLGGVAGLPGDGR